MDDDELDYFTPSDFEEFRLYLLSVRGIHMIGKYELCPKCNGVGSCSHSYSHPEVCKTCSGSGSYFISSKDEIATQCRMCSGYGATTSLFICTACGGTGYSMWYESVLGQERKQIRLFIHRRGWIDLEEFENIEADKDEEEE